MRKLARDSSKLIEGLLLYKTGRVLVNLTDNTYLENVLMDGSENYPIASSTKHELTYSFTDDIYKAIRFHDQFEEWFVYHNCPLVEGQTTGYRDYKGPTNPDGFLTFEPISSISESRNNNE